MIVVYEAANSIDAHLLRGLLEQRGIPAHVTGEYLLGAVGDLPAHGLISVLVPAERSLEARRVIREFDARNAGVTDFDQGADGSADGNADGSAKGNADADGDDLVRFDPAAPAADAEPARPWWLVDEEVDWLGAGLLLGFLTCAHLVRVA